jgi:hypothetical protein
METHHDLLYLAPTHRSMSSALLFGLFELTGIIPNGTTSKPYCTYQTWISCDTANYIDAELRLFSTDSDHTIAYVYGKFYAPSNSKVLIEALRVRPFSW